jgi:hypothetical protein
MTSVRTTNSDHLDARNLAARDCLARLSLKPSGSAKGALDGAWWPRSTDPAIELGTLSEAVGVPVRRIALNMAGWDSAPRRVWRSGRNVAVDWFQTSGVHLVRIVGTDDQRIDLLLIPVDTVNATADLALTMATDGHDPDIAATVGYHSAPVGPPAEAKAFPDNEDGAPDRHAHDRTWAASSDVVGRRRIARLPAHGPS